MQTNNETGGPAFPYSAPEGVFHREGMTLRDWFAGQALSGYLADPNVTTGSQADVNKIAVACYLIAETMLKARQQ